MVQVLLPQLLWMLPTLLLMLLHACLLHACLLLACLLSLLPCLLLRTPLIHWQLIKDKVVAARGEALHTHGAVVVDMLHDLMPLLLRDGQQLGHHSAKAVQVRSGHGPGCQRAAWERCGCIAQHSCAAVSQLVQQVCGVALLQHHHHLAIKALLDGEVQCPQHARHAARSRAQLLRASTMAEVEL